MLACETATKQLILNECITWASDAYSWHLDHNKMIYLRANANHCEGTYHRSDAQQRTPLTHHPRISIYCKVHQCGWHCSQFRPTQSFVVLTHSAQSLQPTLQQVTWASNCRVTLVKLHEAILGCTVQVIIDRIVVSNYKLGSEIVSPLGSLMIERAGRTDCLHHVTNTVHVHGRRARTTCATQ